MARGAIWAGYSICVMRGLLGVCVRNCVERSSSRRMPQRCDSYVQAVWISRHESQKRRDGHKLHSLTGYVLNGRYTWRHIFIAFGAPERTLADGHPTDTSIG